MYGKLFLKRLVVVVSVIFSMQTGTVTYDNVEYVSGSIVPRGTEYNIDGVK